MIPGITSSQMVSSVDKSWASYAFFRRTQGRPCRRACWRGCDRKQTAYHKPEHVFGRFPGGLPDPDNNVQCPDPDLRYGGQRCEKRILIQQIFGRIIGVQIRLSVLEQGVQCIQFQEVVQAGTGHIVEFFCQCFLIEVFMEAKVSEQHQTGRTASTGVSAPLSIQAVQKTSGR